MDVAVPIISSIAAASTIAAAAARTTGVTTLMESLRCNAPAPPTNNAASVR
jgi:hypothetical protein